VSPLELIFLVLSTAFATYAYVQYYADTVRQRISPNRWSWLIWCFTTGVEVFTFQLVSTDLKTTAVFGGSFIACVLTTFVIWSSGSLKGPSRIELACLLASFAALAIAVLFNSAWWGHFIALAAIPVSFLPTYRSAYADWRMERSPSWLFWTLGDLFALAYVVLQLGSARELPYAVVEAICHGGVWVVVRLARSNSQRPKDFRFAASHSDLVTVGENHLGKAVFASRNIERGAEVIRFGGRPVFAAQIPRVYFGASDRYMQIDHDLYLGPSGSADDFFNHSCNPNAGIRFQRDGVYLEALRAIKRGEEICWDYSTTMLSSKWLMKCDCRTSSCRGYVGDFNLLSPTRASFYLKLGVVAPFIVRNLSNDKKAQRTTAEQLGYDLRDPLTIEVLLKRVSAFAKARDLQSSTQTHYHTLDETDRSPPPNPDPTVDRVSKSGRSVR
jgi:hypothetical protein